MREHLFCAVAVVATFQRILSVPTFVFMNSRLVFTILVKNTVLVWRFRALGDKCLSEFLYDIQKNFICTKFTSSFNNSIYFTLCGVCTLWFVVDTWMVGDNEDSYDGGPTSNLAFWFVSSFLDSTHPAFMSSLKQ